MQKNFTAHNQNEQDEYGIFLSILYLVDETQKRRMTLTTATLLTAAQSLVDDCGNQEMANDLSAALTFFKQSLRSKDSRLLEAVTAQIHLTATTD